MKDHQMEKFYSGNAAIELQKAEIRRDKKICLNCGCKTNRYISVYRSPDHPSTLFICFECIKFNYRFVKGFESESDKHVQGKEQK